MGQQGADNLLTDDNRRHRVAGQTDHRFAVHHGKNRRLAGHDVDAVDQHLADRLQGAQRKVVFTGRGAGNDDGHIVVADRFFERPDNFGQLIHNPRPAFGVAAPLFDKGAGHPRVELDDPSRLGRLARFNQLRAGRNDANRWSGQDRNRGVSGGQQGAEVVRPQGVAARQQRLGGDDVLADQADVLPGRGGVSDFHLGVALPEHLLDHDDRVGPGRQRAAGVHILKRAAVGAGPPGVGLGRGQAEGRELTRPKGILGAHRNAVHGRPVVVGGGQHGEDGLGRGPAHSVFHRHRFHPSRRRDGIKEKRQGFAQGFLL